MGQAVTHIKKGDFYMVTASGRITASDKVRALVAEGNYKKALCVVKGFRLGIGKEDLCKIKLAYDCMVHKAFYEQLGTDTEMAITEGIEVLQGLYGRSE